MQGDESMLPAPQSPIGILGERKTATLYSDIDNTARQSVVAFTPSDDLDRAISEAQTSASDARKDQWQGLLWKSPLDLAPQQVLFAHYLSLVQIVLKQVAHIDAPRGGNRPSIRCAFAWKFFLTRAWPAFLAIAAAGSKWMNALVASRNDATLARLLTGFLAQSSTLVIDSAAGGRDVRLEESLKQAIAQLEISSIVSPIPQQNLEALVSFATSKRNEIQTLKQDMTKLRETVAAKEVNLRTANEHTSKLSADNTELQLENSRLTAQLLLTQQQLQTDVFGEVEKRKKAEGLVDNLIKDLAKYKSRADRLERDVAGILIPSEERTNVLLAATANMSALQTELSSLRAQNAELAAFAADTKKLTNRIAVLTAEKAQADFDLQQKSRDYVVMTDRATRKENEYNKLQSEFVEYRRRCEAVYDERSRLYSAFGLFVVAKIIPSNSDVVALESQIVAAYYTRE